MRFEYTYSGTSSVFSRPDSTEMSFSPDVRREPTYFEGRLRKGIEFREAISALHDVVVSDLRFRPKDREEYKAWAAQKEQEELLEILAQRDRVKRQAEAIQNELYGLNLAIQKHMAPYYKAQGKYFRHLYLRDRDAWFVLDPVITVHPDQIFFECFSQDESTYGRLAASYEEFDDIGEFACGTTNIDYSAALYDEFQKIRTYKATRFHVAAEGFEVRTEGEDDYREVKIDLPDSWVRGFLQVSSAMTLPAVSFDLHPMDLFNLCFVLRSRRETHGPRSLRYVLQPGQPVKVIFEPWNHEVLCPRSIFEGNEATEVRVWGRRRLHVMERLIPVAHKIRVHLLGTGMPSFYVVDLGRMSFTLGLSGWTANDWSRAGNFDLMAPRAEVDSATSQKVFEELKESWFETPDVLARKLRLDPSVVLGALGVFSQAGRVIYDLERGVYRARELSREPLPMDQLRFSNPREESANVLVATRQVHVEREHVDGLGHLHLKGRVHADGRRHQTSLRVDEDQRLKQAECSCHWHFKNKLYKGPCEHILALRMMAARHS